MSRYIATFLALMITTLIACSGPGTAGDPKPLDDVKFACVVFNGPSSELKFDGKISPKIYTRWFQENYAVGGERIETPRTATAVGALVLTAQNDSFVMPICTWTIESGHTYFACQSDGIGNAPMLSVCTETKTITEFLEQLQSKLSDIAG